MKSREVHGHLTPAEKFRFMRRKLKKVKTKEMNMIQYNKILISKTLSTEQEERPLEDFNL
jgi:hypothetical protein